MAYCTESDLVARFGKAELASVTDKVAAASSVPQVIADACDEASSQIDSYLGALYTTPIAEAYRPPVLKQWARDLARLNLWGDRAPEGSVVRSNANAALRALRDIANGNAVLPGSENLTAATNGSGIAVLSDGRVFTNEVLAGDWGAFGRPCWQRSGDF
jgi:phage gp36-like protein